MLPTLKLGMLRTPFKSNVLHTHTHTHTQTQTHTHTYTPGYHNATNNRSTQKVKIYSKYVSTHLTRIKKCR